MGTASQTRIADAIGTLLESPSQDQKAEAINVGTVVVNAVDCGNKTDSVCATFNRGSCSIISNTCGGCISGTIGNSLDVRSFVNRSLGVENPT
jgi:hypothetical protein